MTAITFADIWVADNRHNVLNIDDNVVNFMKAITQLYYGPQNIDACVNIDESGIIHVGFTLNR